MARYDNPVRGYIICPVCQSPSTVHQCGEGQLIETGEPPKNSRNIGLQYYRCPQCGNSAISRRGSEFVIANMVTERSALEAASSLASESKTVTDNKAQPLTEVTEVDSVTPPKAEVSNTSASSTDLTEVETDDSISSFPLKRVLAALGAIIFFLWAVSQLLPKKVEQGGKHGAT